MTIRNEYIVFGILALILLWVLYFSQSISGRFDNYDKQLNSLQDSLTTIHQSRKADSILFQHYQSRMDSILAAKPAVKQKASNEKKAIYSAANDSLATIIRSGLDTLQH